MLSLEQEIIIDRAQHPHFNQSFEDVTHKAQGANLSCGDEISLFFHVDNDIITKVYHQTRACTICTASTDILAEKIINTNIANLASLNQEEHLAQLGIQLSPIRQKCAKLPLETLKNLEQA